jgi:3-(3-hydroxy-phenyl)propionate hydroxylase
MEFSRESPIGHSGWRQSTMFDQPDLECALRGALTAHQGTQLMEGCVVERVTAEPEGAVVRIERDAGGSDTLRARYVLGCDGASSLLAAEIGGRSRDLRFTQQWLVVDVRSDHELKMWPGVHQVCAGPRASTYMRIGADRYRWEFRLPPDRDGTPDEIWALAEIRRWLPAGAGDIEIVRTARYRHSARVARRWRSGPLFVLGDAAHLTPPFIGQGLGAGQRDAMNLAWKLAAVIDGRADDRLLDTYRAERAPHVMRSVVAATAIGRAMAVRSAPGRAVVGGVLRGLDAAPGGASVGPRLIYPRIGRNAIPMSERVRRGSGRLGELFPQFVLRHGTNGEMAVGSDDILGSGHVLVHRGRVADELADRANAVRARSVSITDFGGVANDVAAWLDAGHLRAVLVRPDRVVCAGESRSGRVVAMK